MKIKRRALMLATAAWPLAGGAQQSKKVWRIGYLRGTPGIEVTDEAFRQRLRELGFVEGKISSSSGDSCKADPSVPLKVG